MKHLNKEVAALELPELEHPDSIFEVHPMATWVKDNLSC